MHFSKPCGHSCQRGPLKSLWVTFFLRKRLINGSVLEMEGFYILKRQKTTQGDFVQGKVLFEGVSQSSPHRHHSLPLWVHMAAWSTSVSLSLSLLSFSLDLSFCSPALSAGHSYASRHNLPAWPLHPVKAPTFTDSVHSVPDWYPCCLKVCWTAACQGAMCAAVWGCVGPCKGCSMCCRLLGRELRRA